MAERTGVCVQCGGVAVSGSRGRVPKRCAMCAAYKSTRTASPCAFCGSGTSLARFCSDSCRGKAWRAANSEHTVSYNKARFAANYGAYCSVVYQTCTICGNTFTSAQQRVHMICRAAPCRRKRQAERMQQNYKDQLRANRQLRRARERAAPSERISPAKVYERDGWVCGICSTAVDPALKYPNLMSVSLDHVQPLSLGGGHLYGNVRCAHLLCNIRRGNRVDSEQPA